MLGSVLTELAMSISTSISMTLTFMIWSVNFFLKNWINFDKKGKKARRCTSLLRSADERTCTWNPFNRTSQQLSQKSQNKHELETQGAIWYLLVNHYTAPQYEFWIKIVADPRIKTFDPRKQIISHYFGFVTFRNSPYLVSEWCSNYLVTFETVKRFGNKNCKVWCQWLKLLSRSESKTWFKCSILSVIEHSGIFTEQVFVSRWPRSS